MRSPSWSFRAVCAAALLALAIFPRPLHAQVNRAPVLTPVGAIVGSAGVPLSIPLSADDPEGGLLRFEVAGPPGMVLTDNGDGTAECNWMPGPDQVGNHALSFTVTDDGAPPASDSESMMLTIGPGNRPPVLAPIGNRGYDPDVHLVIDLSARDNDGDDLSYSVDIAPPGDVFLEDFGDGTGRWNWVDPSGSASYELTFTVTDTGEPPASDSETIVLSLNRTNRPPVLSPIGDRRVRAGELLLVSLAASDPDADLLAFSALGVPQDAEFVDLGGGAAELRWTPSADQVGVYEVVVAVADNGVPAEVASEIFDITVEAPPAPPVGNLRVDRAVWSKLGRLLLASGSGARPRETVSILDAASGALLGVSRANSRGYFLVVVSPFLAPCAVSARTLEAESAARPVDWAPKNCGKDLLTRVRDVEWRCKRSKLSVKAERAPASGTIDVSDAASGQLLGSIPVDHHGWANGRLALPASPARVKLFARSGDGAWYVGAYDVENCRKRCGHKRDKRRR